MKKTPVAARFTRQLIQVNDQVCFAALQQWEFEQTVASAVFNQPKDYTPAIFNLNPFAEAIYRRIEELPAFGREAQQVALRMGIIASVEHILAYIEEVQEFRQGLVAEAGDVLTDDAPEEQLRLKVESWSGHPPTTGYFRTLGYLRHLRNHYAHLNARPHPSFRAYAQSYGTPLNGFWNNGVTDLHGVDFKSLLNVALTPDLTFGLMNVMRVSLLHVDNFVASTLGVADAARSLLQGILAIPRNRQLVPDRIASKLRMQLEMEWGLTVSRTESLILVQAEMKT